MKRIIMAQNTLVTAIVVALYKEGKKEITVTVLKQIWYKFGHT